MASNEWRQRTRPERLERRYEFDDYEELREFLDRAAELSEREGLYPDIGFSRHYANFTIHVEEGKPGLTPREHEFALQLDRLFVPDNQD